MSDVDNSQVNDQTYVPDSSSQAASSSLFESAYAGLGTLSDNTATSGGGDDNMSTFVEPVMTGSLGDDSLSSILPTVDITSPFGMGFDDGIRYLEFGSADESGIDVGDIGSQVLDSVDRQGGVEDAGKVGDRLEGLVNPDVFANTKGQSVLDNVNSQALKKEGEILSGSEHDSGAGPKDPDADVVPGTGSAPVKKEPSTQHGEIKPEGMDDHDRQEENPDTHPHGDVREPIHHDKDADGDVDKEPRTEPLIHVDTTPIPQPGIPSGEVPGKVVSEDGAGMVHGPMEPTVRDLPSSDDSGMVHGNFEPTVRDLPATDDSGMVHGPFEPTTRIPIEVDDHGMIRMPEMPGPSDAPPPPVAPEHAPLDASGKYIPPQPQIKRDPLQDARPRTSASNGGWYASPPKGDLPKEGRQ